jgi:predicted ATPase
MWSAVFRRSCCNSESLSLHAPALKALLNLNVTDTDWTTFDLIDRKRRLASAFLEVCRLQIRYRPLFIVIDDAQWCDTETIQLLPNAPEPQLIWLSVAQECHS